MNEEIVAVMTRAQKKRMEEEDKRDVFNKSTNNRPDQPRVVELLKKPNECVELMFVKEDELRLLIKGNKVNIEDECFAYSKQKNILYVNLKFRAQFTRAEFVTKLSKFCEKIKVDELCIVKNGENSKFIEDVLKEIKTIKDWTGPRICVIKGVKKIEKDEDKQFILNDFHLLPTRGHAGVRRMINNIRRKFYWPGMDKDVQTFVSKCAKCQKMKCSWK